MQHAATQSDSTSLFSLVISGFSRQRSSTRSWKPVSCLYQWKLHLDREYQRVWGEVTFDPLFIYLLYFNLMYCFNGLHHLTDVDILWLKTRLKINFSYSWTTRGSASSCSSPARLVKNEFASTNKSAITSESARREHSTASTARSHFTLKTLRLEMIHRNFRFTLGFVFACAALCVPLKETLTRFQAHDEICPKYPMICEGCAKKKIPREKVNVETHTDKITFPCNYFSSVCASRKLLLH